MKSFVTYFTVNAKRVSHAEAQAPAGPIIDAEMETEAQPPCPRYPQFTASPNPVASQYVMKF